MGGRLDRYQKFAGLASDMGRWRLGRYSYDPILESIHILCSYMSLSVCYSHGRHPSLLLL